MRGPLKLKVIEFLLADGVEREGAGDGVIPGGGVPAVLLSVTTGRHVETGIPLPSIGGLRRGREAASQRAGGNEC